MDLVYILVQKLEIWISFPLLPYCLSSYAWKCWLELKKKQNICPDRTISLSHLCVQTGMQMKRHYFWRWFICLNSSLFMIFLYLIILVIALDVWVMNVFFRALKCMDLVTGPKLPNMLEQKANHNVLTTIMPYT